MTAVWAQTGTFNNALLLGHRYKRFLQLDERI
jgi:hypothetical protein